MPLPSFPITTPSGKTICRPARPINYGIKVNTLVFAADSGFEQRRSKGASYSTFEFTYPALSLEEYQTIRTFFLLVTNTQAFTWTDPVEKTSYTVRFDMDSFSAQQKYHGPSGPAYELALKLKQVSA